MINEKASLFTLLSAIFCMLLDMPLCIAIIDKAAYCIKRKGHVEAYIVCRGFGAFG